MDLLKRFRSESRGGCSYGMYQNVVIPRLYYSTFGEEGGHSRLFGGPKNLGGFMIYSYNKMGIGWASRFVYMLVPGLVALIHEDTQGGTLKTRSEQTGWFLRFAKIKFSKVYKGFEVKFIAPETYL